MPLSISCPVLSFSPRARAPAYVSRQGDSTSASAWSAGDKDGERRSPGFEPSQHRGSRSGSAWRPSDDDGNRRARGIQLGQHRGCTSASARSTSHGVSDAAAAGRPPPQQDVADIPVSAPQSQGFFSRGFQNAGPFGGRKGRPAG
jgi:hypothetical protein